MILEVSLHIVDAPTQLLEHMQDSSEIFSPPENINESTDNDDDKGLDSDSDNEKFESTKIELHYSSSEDNEKEKLRNK